MANFNNGKIYALRNHINDLVFVGNTTQSLSLRLAQHKSDYTLTTIKTHKIYQAIKLLGFHNFYIELIEAYPCKSRDELVREQNEYRREYNSYNNGYNGFVKNEIDIRTEPIKEWIKNVSYEPKKHTCKICNTDISLSSKSRHEKTDKHKYNIINKIVDKKTENYHRNIGTVFEGV